MPKSNLAFLLKEWMESEEKSRKEAADILRIPVDTFHGILDNNRGGSLQGPIVKILELLQERKEHTKKYEELQARYNELYELSARLIEDEETELFQNLKTTQN